MSNTTTPHTQKHPPNLNQQAQDLIHRYGEDGYQIARKAILNDTTMNGAMSEALGYFIDNCWPNRQHPALLSLACEAVGGDPHAPDRASAGLVLLTGAADAHDDIMDHSQTKAKQPTLYGKYGLDTTLLAGDILLLKAQTLLNVACQNLPPKTQQTIHTTIENAFVEIACAVDQERKLKDNFHIDPKQYWRIIEAKGAVSDAFAQVGALFGQAIPEQVGALGKFGRTLGVLMAVKNEIFDLLNPQELGHRVRYETLPLPVLYGVHDLAVGAQVLQLLNGRITKTVTAQVTELCMNTKAVKTMIKKMQTRAKEEKNALGSLKNQASLGLLLDLAIADI